MVLITWSTLTFLKILALSRLNVFTTDCVVIFLKHILITCSSLLFAILIFVTQALFCYQLSEQTGTWWLLTAKHLSYSLSEPCSHFQESSGWRSTEGVKGAADLFWGKAPALSGNVLIKMLRLVTPCSC